MNRVVEPSKGSKLRRYAFSVITLLISLGLSLSAAEWVLRYWHQQIEGSDRLDHGMVLYDPHLGWRLSPNWAGKHYNWDFDAAYSIDQFGLRGDGGDPEGREIVALVGDSFTFGQGVNDDQTFVHHLNLLAGGRTSFLNFSVPGYSTDQQLLLTRQRVWLFRPKILVLVVYLGNDLFDNMLAYPLQGEHGKPLFHARDGDRLELTNVPVPLAGKPAAAKGKTLWSVVLGKSPPQTTGLAGWLGQLELSRRLAMFQSEPEISAAEMSERFAPALRLFRLIVKQMRSEAEQQGASFRMALLSGRSFVREPESISARFQDHLRRSILETLTETPVLDLATMLREANESGLAGLYYPNEGHLTPEGNRLVAKRLAEWLGTAAE